MTPDGLSTPDDLKHVLTTGRIPDGIGELREAGYAMKRVAAALVMGADVLDGMRLRTLDTLSDEDAKRLHIEADRLFDSTVKAFCKAQDGHWNIVEVMDAYFDNELGK